MVGMVVAKSVAWAAKDVSPGPPVYITSRGMVPWRDRSDPSKFLPSFIKGVIFDQLAILAISTGCSLPDRQTFCMAQNSRSAMSMVSGWLTTLVISAVLSAVCGTIVKPRSALAFSAMSAMTE